MIAKKAQPTRSKNLRGVVRNLTPAQYLAPKVSGDQGDKYRHIVSTRSTTGLSEVAIPYS